MDRSRLYRAEGLVLKGYDYGEADRILTLFTSQFGKIRCVAKGVRRTKSRKAGHLDLFTRTSLQLARGRQLDIVTQAETVESFPEMRLDLWRTGYAHYVADLLENFSAESLPNYPLYTLAVRTMRRLATHPNIELVVRAFEMQLLALTGYRPQLHRCLGCDNLIVPGQNYFSARMGGVLCTDCTGLDHAAPAISINALKVLRNLQTNEEAVLHLTAIDDETQQEIGRRLQEYVLYRLESKPRSIAVLERLRQEHPLSAV